MYNHLLTFSNPVIKNSLLQPVPKGVSKVCGSQSPGAPITSCLLPTAAQTPSQTPVPQKCQDPPANSSTSGMGWIVCGLSPKGGTAVFGLGLIREGLPVLPRKLESSQAITQREKIFLRAEEENQTQDCGGTCSRSHCKSLLELD